jgi:alkylation response protein AidB-like acyl-CoA dehydrogenase
MNTNRLSNVAPDTEGWNFYTADQSLQDLLELYLPMELYQHLQPYLERMGHLTANELDQAARLANQHTPILHHRDRFGEDRQWIEYHPSYKEMEKVAFGEFGMHAMGHKEGILNWSGKLPTVAKHAFTYLFNQAEFGMGCPINVTDSGAHILEMFGDAELKSKFLHLMLSQDMGELLQSGQYITEKEGGSDVGAATTTAHFDGTHWRITGQKWFCSNADAGVVLLLARPEGGAPGTRGLSLFLMPRLLDDGTPNHYRMVRLKDKLGTKSMASAEVILDGAVAYMVGDPGNGFKQMAEMVNWSRISNGVKSTALMRRACHDATAVLKGRLAFGEPLFEKPLARRQMLKILLSTEQATSFYHYTAHTLDRSMGSENLEPSQEAASILRLLTPVLKFRATRDGRTVTGDALDMRAGCGYIEDWVNPRLVRDSYCGSVWEGAGNIVALDAMTRAIAKHHCHDALQADLSSKIEELISVPEHFRIRLQEHLSKSIGLANTVANSEKDEASCRQATSALYNVISAILMSWEAVKIEGAKGDGRRILWARLVLDHRLEERSPYNLVDPDWEDAVSRILLSEEKQSISQVSMYL